MRRRGVDPNVPILGVLALLVYSLHGFGGPLTRDLAVYGYGAQQVAEGVPPYVGILTRAGPLAQMIPGLGVMLGRIVGIDDLVAMRLLFMAISVASVCLVYLVGRDLFDSRLAGLAAATALLSFSGFIEYASNGPREKTAMVLFLLCAFLAIRGQRWLAAGVSVSLATLVWQLSFFVGIAAVLVGLLGLPSSERLRACARVVVGGSIPLAACLLYFAAMGALSDFLQGYVLINARYSQSNPIWANFSDKWLSLQSGFGLSLWILLAGLAAILALSVPVLVAKYLRRQPAHLSVAALGAATVVGLYVMARTFTDWPDALLLVPMAALGAGGLLITVARSLSLRAATALALAWLSVTVLLAFSYSLGERDDGLERQRASVNTVLSRLPDDASILSIEAPEALVLSGKANPTPYQMFPQSLSTYVNGIWPGGLEGYGRWVARREPTLVTLGGAEAPPWLEGTLDAEYRRVGRAPGWVWWMHRSLGRELISATRDAVRAQRSR